MFRNVSLVNYLLKIVYTLIKIVNIKKKEKEKEEKKICSQTSTFFLNIKIPAADIL